MIKFNHEPSRRDLAWFGVLFAGFLALVGVLLHFRFGWSTAARGCWIAAPTILVLYTLIPPIRRPLFIAWMRVTYPIGWVLSHVILGVIWYGVVTPIGLFMRLRGRDALRRRPDPEATSYWEAYEIPDDPERAFRQY